MIPDSKPDYLPLSHFILPEDQFANAGKKLLTHGKIGALVLAGGQGSRLRFSDPKGCFPITPVHKKSLYQLLAEKILAASRTYGHDLPLAIMTSDATHEKSVQHFQEANYFGLKKEQLHFFKQENLPLQDMLGNTVAITAPDGNGQVLTYFKKSGIYNLWKGIDISHVTIFNIDNALADPFQPDLVGLHDLHQNQATVVGIQRKSADEPVGVLVERSGKLAVVEYSEMQESERRAQNETRGFKHPLANITYFAFSMDFIGQDFRPLPLHRAKKRFQINGGEEYFYKSEYFIFDLLDQAERTEVLQLAREEYFAPLKNHEGQQSIASVQAQLSQHDRKAYFALTGNWPPEDRPFELSPLFTKENP